MIQADWICCLSGAPHRVNGKVSGHLRVGHTPVHFTNVDLHAYIVGNDGRAYTAISHIPQPAAQALLPLTPIGGLFGWLFALQKPGWENGFSFTGESEGPLKGPLVNSHHALVFVLGARIALFRVLEPQVCCILCGGSWEWLGLPGLFLKD